MKKYLFLSALSLIGLFAIGCNNDDHDSPKPTTENQKPGTFTVQVSQITENSALLSWNTAVDPDDDLVSYTLFLEGNELKTKLETTNFPLESLTAQTDYKGKVVASDGNGNTSEATFTFTTEEEEEEEEEEEINTDGVSIAWEKSFGGSKIDMANSLQLTVDGGYIIAGTSESDDGDVGGNNDAENYLGGDFWITKLSNSGDLLWETNLGGSSDEAGNDIQQTADGGYIVVGTTYSNDQDISGDASAADFWIVKLDGSGNLIWETNYGGSSNEEATSVAQTLDGGYIVAGFSASSDGDVGGNKGGLDYWILKLDNDGLLVWESPLGGAAFDIAKSVEQTSDGGYIVAGYSESIDGDVGGNYGEKDYWVVKLDALGDLVWEKHLGGSLEDYAYDIHQTTDQGYIVAGYSESSDFDVSANHGNKDYWIVKLDTSGEITWEVNLGSSSVDTAYAIEQTSDQGYIIAGSAGTTDFDVSGPTNGGFLDYWIVKLNSSGELRWETSIGSPENDYANAVQQTDDGYIVAGYTQGIGGDVSGTGKGQWDYWVVKLE
ncbi:fibronectin type III domain-containing protein [Zobellia uliginosa]|uniref:fibronectin type III domain-containing protein n=1 Tax=Zobellia uliginosa TaxID=143224 RepID=UPI0026E26971|nr:fibronectin type III domain-containing protein [Zobellia uliginosa]MDO6518467.1 fibronectin type III domain-containing protein [Zobellia uliginosa]